MNVKKLIHGKSWLWTHSAVTLLDPSLAVLFPQVSSSAFLRYLIILIILFISYTTVQQQGVVCNTIFLLQFWFPRDSLIHWHLSSYLLLSILPISSISTTCNNILPQASIHRFSFVCILIPLLTPYNDILPQASIHRLSCVCFLIPLLTPYNDILPQASIHRVSFVCVRIPLRYHVMRFCFKLAYIVSVLCVFLSHL